MNVKKINAIAYLGLNFVLHFFKRVLHINQRGKAEFLEAYRKDRIFSVSAEHRKNFPDYSSCIVCQLCDTVCPALPGTATTTPSFIVASFSRSLTDFHLLNFDTNACTSCSHCEEVCPEDVPIKNILEFMNSGQLQTLSVK